MTNNVLLQERRSLLDSSARALVLLLVGIYFLARGFHVPVDASGHAPFPLEEGYTATLHANTDPSDNRPIPPCILITLHQPPPVGPRLTFMCLTHHYVPVGICLGAVIHRRVR